jgi:hypothetical protein
MNNGISYIKLKNGHLIIHHNLNNGAVINVMFDRNVDKLEVPYFRTLDITYLSFDKMHNIPKLYLNYLAMLLASEDAMIITIHHMCRLLFSSNTDVKFLTLNDDNGLFESLIRSLYPDYFTDNNINSNIVIYEKEAWKGNALINRLYNDCGVRRCRLISSGGIISAADTSTNNIQVIPIYPVYSAPVELSNPKRVDFNKSIMLYILVHYANTTRVSKKAKQRYNEHVREYLAYYK